VVRGKVVGEIDMFDLLKAALRQRPEYIIVGEIRGEEAYVLFQAMATGHSTYSTFHADSVASLVHRFVHPPINVPHMMMASLNVVSVQKIVLINGKRSRRIIEVTEIVGIDPQTNEILTNELFKWDSATDTHEMVSSSVVLREIADMNGITREEMSEEFNNRVKVIRWAQENNIRHYIKFSELVYDYYKDKNEVLSRISGEVEKKDINSLGERIKTIGEEDGAE
jgi:flagellar protein FlaI